jgi:hypothetical protein
MLNVFLLFDVFRTSDQSNFWEARLHVLKLGLSLFLVGVRERERTVQRASGTCCLPEEEELPV